MKVHQCRENEAHAYSAATPLLCSVLIYRVPIRNHDKDWMKRINLSDHFISVQLMAEINDKGCKNTLCHYPMMSWNGCNKGTFHIHGHIHNNRNDCYWPLLWQMPHALNAGVDINGFAPVSFDELLENNRIFKASEGWNYLPHLLNPLKPSSALETLYWVV